jgi:hypothetical protein
MQSRWCHTNEEKQEQPSGPIEGFNVGLVVQVSRRILNKESMVDLEIIFSQLIILGTFHSFD